MGLTYKVWHGVTITILLLMTIQFTLQGFFRQKAILTNKTSPEHNPRPNDRKVIMVLIDALREDFVELDETASRHARLTQDMPTHF
jgi:predicted AlkP superfamily pyrophosphatase or phosphodiesterase